MSNVDFVDAHRDKLLVWAEEGKSYFWMAQQIGLNDRNACAVSKWFIAQGVRRKAAK